MRISLDRTSSFSPTDGPKPHKHGRSRARGLKGIGSRNRRRWSTYDREDKPTAMSRGNAASMWWHGWQFPASNDAVEPTNTTGTYGSLGEAFPLLPRVSRAQDMSDIGRYPERWDIYYHQYLLHSCMHSECIWMEGMWYFPEPGRRADTLHMFTPSRFGPIDDFKYYDFHLPNGTMIEQMAWRYIGNGDPTKEWLQDYVAYDLNMVTVDMVVLVPGEVDHLVN